MAGWYSSRRPCSPGASVAANAGFGLKVRGMRRTERMALVESHLHMVGLWDFRDRYPYELSSGMQQRLAIVRALVNRPKVMLMDEPFGGLDALTHETMQEELHAVWRQTGMTVLLITHSVEEAIYLGTDVVVMSPRPGRVVERVASRSHDWRNATAGRSSPCPSSWRCASGCCR